MKLSRHIRGWLLYWKMRIRYAFSRMKPLPIPPIDDVRFTEEQRKVVEYIQRETLRQFFASDVGQGLLDALDFYNESMKLERIERQRVLSKPWWPRDHHKHKTKIQ
jgi:hypothetical protein